MEIIIQLLVVSWAQEVPVSWAQEVPVSWAQEVPAYLTFLVILLYSPTPHKKEEL